MYIQLKNEEQARDFFEESIKIKSDYSGSNQLWVCLTEIKNTPWQLFNLKKFLPLTDSEKAFINLTKVYFDDGRLLK